MKRSETGKTTKAHILTTAEEIVIQHGVLGLTFDKVAAVSGLSKGGILYHFKSKNELIKAMVEQFVARFEEGLHNLELEDQQLQGRYTRAYLRATMGEAASTGGNFDRLGASITAALSTFPNYLDIIRRQNDKCQRGVENDGLDPVVATVIRLAVEGMWMAEVFQVYQLEADMKRRVIARLLEWTRRKS